VNIKDAYLVKNVFQMEDLCLQHQPPLAALF
jgi:hypothetical protein